MTPRPRPSQPGDWTYESSGGTRYPVRPGEVWQVTARHTYVCADLMADTAFVAGLVSAFAPTLIYSDPPWGTALTNGFRTKAGLTGPAPYTWVDLYRRVATLVPADTPVWLESGKRELIPVQTRVLHDRPNTRWFPITYFRTHPAVLHYAGPTPPPMDPSGLDDSATPYEVLNFTAASGRVLDPCAGRGLTATSAERAGWRSLSVELSRYRVSAGLHALSTVTGIEAQRVARAPASPQDEPDGSP